MADKTYGLPQGEYNPTFLKALACAIHCNVLEPSELAYWLENGWTHHRIAMECYNRVKPKGKR